MIKNQRQYQVSLEQFRQLSVALNDARTVANPDVFRGAHIMALEADIQTLEDDMRQYDRLLEGEFNPGRLRDVEHLGRDLIRARIACRLTQKDLATALGKKEQAIQRLEATDYRSASLATIEGVVAMLMSHGLEATQHTVDG